MLKPGRSTAASFDSVFTAESIRRQRLRSEFQRALWLVSVRTPLIAWRIFEILVATVLSLLALPVLAPFYLIAKFHGGGIRRATRIGQDGKEFQEFSLFDPTRPAPNRLFTILGRMPSLVNIFLANMSLVGPRSLSPSDVSFSDRSVWKRFASRPGVVGLWWVRKQANIAYESEAVVDAEYVQSKTMGGDVGILLRSLPAAFLGARGTRAASHKIDILGVQIHNMGMDQAVAEIVASLAQPQPSQVCFVNVDCINIAQRDAEYAELLSHCPLVLADGIGLKLAGDLLGTPIRQNVNGTDLLPLLCQKLALAKRSIYLLGGKPGVAEDLAQWMRATFPDLTVAGAQHGYFHPQDLPAIAAAIKASGTDLLLVAMGAPKQDKWLRAHLSATGAKVGIGVGGLFDFYSGRMERAPIWIREIGMEWAFRLCKEPRRMWKRYVLGNAIFAARILAHRLHRAAPRPAFKGSPE